MGKRPAGHFGQAHAARAVRLGQEESRVVLQAAFGRQGFAQRTHMVKKPNIAQNYTPSSVTVRKF
jgi:ribosomal protein L15